jgi:transcription antitermination factor NusG
MQSVAFDRGILPVSQVPAVVPQQEIHWYAVQTSARHEKRVYQRFVERSVESFLPLYETVNRWKDRKVRVQLPLFPGYLFVHLDLADRLNVLQVAGVTRFVNFGGVAIPIPAVDIESLRAGLIGGLRAEPHPYLKVGRRARVKSGPLQAMVGILLRKKNLERFIISLDLIQRSISVEIDATELESISETEVAREKRPK